jgi:transposase
MDGGNLMAYISGVDRGQMVLFPESLDEYIDEDNPIRVIDAFVNQLDIQKAGFLRYVPAKEGRPGYDPRDIIKLYIYGYFNKIRSSRKLMAECKRNVEVMWLLRKLIPDFRTVADFRKDNPQAIKNVFRAFVRLCDSMGLYNKELVSIDGSKFKAVTQKIRNFTHVQADDRIRD